MRQSSRRAMAIALLALLPACYELSRSDGGGEASFAPPRRIVPADVAVPSGYRLEVVAQGLTFPTGVAFDRVGTPYVTEAGYSYGEAFTTPRLLRVGPDGKLVTIASGDRPPWTGVDFANGVFYVAEGGHLGRVVKVTPQGRISVLVDQLSSMGDHHTNGPIVGPDGWVYFGQGTATNAGVVGPDNAQYGWLKRYPAFHDVPGQDVTLRGENFVSADPLSTDPHAQAVTGAFLPFGTPSRPGQVIKGATRGSGTILRVRPQGGAVEQVAWGFRNPFGLAFAPDGTLYVTENGHDERGSRPIFGAPDFLWAIKRGAWYGFPDYVGGRPVTDPAFKPPRGPQPGFLLASHPQQPPKPAASLGVHASCNGFDFSRQARFGPVGHAYVAQFGDLAPDVGKVLGPVGFKVVEVDPKTGVVTDFAANKGPHNGPASKLGSGGLERPVAARFSPDGAALYVVDFGVMTVGAHGPEPHPGTGVLWRITREGGPR